MIREVLPRYYSFIPKLRILCGCNKNVNFDLIASEKKFNFKNSQSSGITHLKVINEVMCILLQLIVPHESEISFYFNSKIHHINFMVT